MKVIESHKRLERDYRRLYKVIRENPFERLSIQKDGHLHPNTILRFKGDKIGFPIKITLPDINQIHIAHNKRELKHILYKYVWHHFPVELYYTVIFERKKE